MCSTVVCNDRLFVLRLESVKLASEFPQRGFGIAKAEGAGLFKGVEGRRDARERRFVWCDVEVCDCMRNELQEKSVELAEGMDYVKVTVAGSSSRSMPTAI